MENALLNFDWISGIIWNDNFTERNRLDVIHQNTTLLLEIETTAYTALCLILRWKYISEEDQLKLLKLWKIIKSHLAFIMIFYVYYKMLIYN